MSNNGNKRRSQRRQGTSAGYHVRYDRIVAVVLVLIVLIVILTSCVKSCSNDSKKSDKSTASSEETSDSTANNTIVDNLTSGEASSVIITGTDKTQTAVLQYASETHTSADINRGNLILVNDSHEYSFENEDSEPLTLYDNIDSDYYSVSDNVIRLDSETIEQLNSIMEAFYRETQNSDLTVIGGYRTLEDQNNRFNNGNSHFQGGYSDYHTARTFDLGIFPKDGSSSGYYSASGIYAWFDEHAADYGFIVRFPEGKDAKTGEQSRTQTYRYVGIPHAAYIRQNELCLEEYIEEVKTHNSSEPLEINANGKLYNVYYVQASGTSDTDVTVPSNKTYTVSGTNTDGFIVTVEIN